MQEESFDLTEAACCLVPGCPRAGRDLYRPRLVRHLVEAVPLDQPSRVVDLLEVDQGMAELLDGVEGPHLEEVLFQGADKLY